MQALTRGLAEVADVEPWTAVFNPGVSTLDRLVELTHEVDFAAFVFAQDDWTSNPADADRARARPRRATTWSSRPACSAARWACAARSSSTRRAPSCRPTCSGMTAVRYPEALTAADMRTVNQKLRKAIEDEGRLTRIEGDWWQHSLTLRSEREPSAISLLRISRDREGGLEVAGRGWQEDGTLSSRYWSVASKEHRDPPSVFYFWNGERPRHPNAPQLEGTGEIRLEDADRAVGLLDHPVRHRPPAPRADRRGLPPRRSGRHARPRRRRSDNRAPSCSPCASRSGRRSRTPDLSSRGAEWPPRPGRPPASGSRSSTRRLRRAAPRSRRPTAGRPRRPSPARGPFEDRSRW